MDFETNIPVSLDDNEENNMITISNYERSWILSREQLYMSEVITQALQGDPKCSTIEFNKPTWVLDKIVSFIEYHSAEPMMHIERPLTNFNFQSNVSSWDFNFVNDLNNSDLVNLIIESDYFIIKDLLSLCLCKMACIVKNNTFVHI